MQSLYHGHRFPAAVISCAVRWDFRFQWSLRDIEELLFERGVIDSYKAIRLWCDKFGAGFAHRVKAARRKPRSTWHLNECVLRRAASLICCGEPSTSMAPNSTSSRRSVATRRRPSVFSSACLPLVPKGHARS